MEQSDISPDVRCRSSPRRTLLMALTLTAFLTVLLVGMRSTIPMWAMMSIAGAVAGGWCVAERDRRDPLVRIALVAGAAAGGVVGATTFLCPLLCSGEILGISLGLFVGALAILGVVGGACGGIAGLLVGWMVREYRNPSTLDEEASDAARAGDASTEGREPAKGE